MCRVCGRMIKCVLDSMPSRMPVVPTTAALTTTTTAGMGTRVGGRQFSTAIRHRPQAQSATRINALELPYRAKLHQTATVQQDLLSSSSFPPPPPPPSVEQIKQSSASATSPNSPNGPPLVLSKSVQELLPALSAQQPQYIKAHIHRFPYLLTTGDTLRLPFHLHGVSPGDVLRFNRASILGSRDYTLKAGLGDSTSSAASQAEGKEGKEVELQPWQRRRREPRYVDERLFECRVRVLGVENQPMQIKEKTKRRNRKVKKVRSKHKYTVCRVMEVRVRGLEEVMQQAKGVVVLE